MVEVYPLPDQEAATCITAVYNGMFSRFGVPRQLHSDQSRNFESQLVTELCRSLQDQDYSVPPSVRWIDRTSQSGHTGYATCRHIQRHKAVAVEASFSVGRLPNDGTLNYRSDNKSSNAMLGREVPLLASLIVAPPEENLPQSGYVRSDHTVPAPRN